MLVNESTRRNVRALLTALAVAATFLAAGCSSSRAPVTTSPVPSTSASPVATSQPQPSAATTPAQPGVDAAGGAIGTTLTITPGTKPAVGTIPKPTDAEVIAAAKTVLAKNEDAAVTSGKVLARTQDAKGHWWVLVSVTVPSLGEEKAILTFDGKKWDDTAFGLDINNEDLPADVKF
jgi:hypothetical protein